MLWASLRFPELALDALASGDACGKPRPLALVDGPPQRRLIAIANAAARAFGVRAGQTVAAAQALCTQLATAPRDEAAERRTLESLAAWAYRFSAEVGIDAPDALRLEVGASLKLFGGWPALERRLRCELDALGFRHRIAAAPTATGARVLADVADGTAIATGETLVRALGDVPLARSGLDADVATALSRMGFRRLREIFQLPRAELARRIGTDALRHLDRMRGLAAEPAARYRPPDRFERRIEMNYGVESSAALLFPLQRAVRELAMFLAARDGGVQRFAIVLGHERQATTRIEIGLLAPAREDRTLFELARARLERVELVAPVHAFTLCADDLPPLCPLHRDLFDASRRETLEWPELAERLRARLGDEALRGIACAADHRPEHAWRFVSLASDGASAPPAKSATVVSLPSRPPRPLWLLPKARALRAAAIEVLSGPERIESGWWDGEDCSRDYYRVRLGTGQRAWAYAPRGETDGLMLHGWFA